MATLKRSGFLLVITMLLCYSCSERDEASYSWKPVIINDGLDISNPEEQGLNPILLDNTYREAANLDNLYSLLILKNGYLVAEKYFNGVTVYDGNRTASVTKSIVSALTGIAIRENFITTKDKKIKDFFPEIDWASIDPLKSEITVEQILQMRSGYPWEEFNGYLELLTSSSNWLPFLEEFPLLNNPGAEFGYSNLTAHMMGIAITRSSGLSLLSFARRYLFDEMAITVTNWPADVNGYYYGSGDIQITARSMAKFGQLYLDSGLWNQKQLIPSKWVNESLCIYSNSTYDQEILNNISALAYGYLWWSATAANHRIWFAWGHGGQMIVLIRDLKIVIVATASVPNVSDAYAWSKEKAVMELVGSLIKQL